MHEVFKDVVDKYLKKTYNKSEKTKEGKEDIKNIELNKKSRAYFVYGLALHTAADAFAHSAYAYSEYKIEKKGEDFLINTNVVWDRITHGEENKDGFINNIADDTKYYERRYNAAKEVIQNIINSVFKIEKNEKGKDEIKDYCVGKKTDFWFSKTGYTQILEKNGTDITPIEISSDNKITYLENAFGLRGFEKYAIINMSESEKAKMSDSEKEKINNYNTFVSNIDSINIQTIVSKWGIVNIKNPTINLKITNMKVYQVIVDKNKKTQYKNVADKNKSAEIYSFVFEKGATYIVTANALPVSQTTGQKNKTTAQSTNVGRYVWTKEIYIDEGDESDYLMNDDYQIMCLGTELEINESDFVTASLKGRITIADTDNNNNNDEVLPNATITLTDYNDNSFQVTANSDNSGLYEFSELAPGVYTMTVQKEGYLDAQYTVIVRSNEPNVFNPVISMISQSFEGKGSASGIIVDAATGIGVEGLTLKFRKGLGESKSTPIMEMKTGAGGAYSTEKLAAGHYTVQIVDEREVEDEAEKYYESSMHVLILGGYALENQNGVVSNNLKKEQLRIVLTWGANPNDLDSHLIGITSDGKKAHMYYANKVITNSQGDVEFELDVDDTSSYGPETTTIYKPIDDDYDFLVYNYSHGSDEELMKSGAMVQVYRGISNIPWYTFYVPQEAGYCWSVFSYDGKTGKLIPDGKVTKEMDSWDELLEMDNSNRFL